jgi:hypothetical protein
MHSHFRTISLAIVTVAGSALLAGAHAAGQNKPSKGPAPNSPPQAVATIQTEKDVREIQDQLIKILRQTPTLTTVVARDPSLLSNQDYVAKNNPQLAEFLTAHPEVARNPDYYLFTHLNRDGGEPDEALERAAWPDMYRAQRPRTGWDDLLSNVPPILAVGSFLLAFLWLARLFIDNRRWTRIFNMQNQVHTKLIERFSNSQELAAYMETDAGRRFLEAAPIPVNLGTGQRVPNAVARVLTPVQIGVVMVLLGIGFLLLRHVQADMETPMLVLGTVILMPGIGFIISAGITWLLASRLGLMPTHPNDKDPGSGIPPRPEAADRFDATLGSSEHR